MPQPFLTAEWRKLAMANYVVDPAVLLKYLPAGTELDFWNGRCYVSLVAFLFTETRILGIKIPKHVEFEEVNLRFYVRRNDNGVWKRGVVFISEIVPKPFVTLVANLFYAEHYQTLPMRHRFEEMSGTREISYAWKKQSWNNFRISTGLNASPIEEASEEEFITEHYWGYTRISDQKTSEYEVRHPRWDMYASKDYTIDVDFSELYEPGFSFLKTQKPVSVFVAEGSPIRVEKGQILKSI